MSCDNPKLTCFEVEIPWGGSSDAGTYSSVVWAADSEAAIAAVALEMADGCAEDEIADSARGYADMQGTIVCEVAPVVAFQLSELFHRELYPDGTRRALDMDKVGVLLAAHREEILK